MAERPHSTIDAALAPALAPALIEAVAAITTEAGEMAMARWRTDFRRWEKVPGSPVCEVDLDVDRLLHDRLRELLPEAGWLSEETADRPDRLDRARVWVVDPIDGTRDYIRGRPGWSVSVALVEDGQPVLGVLHAPARDELWRAVRGGGATRNGVALRVAKRDVLAGARMPIDTLPRADRSLVAVAKPNSIALRIAMVASGEADLIATQRWGNEWDVAAAVVIAAEAGATVTDAMGAPLTFNKPAPRAFGILASVLGIHAEALAHFGGRAAEMLRG